MLGSFENYLRNKSKSTIPNAIPTILCHDGGWRKKRIPVGNSVKEHGGRSDFAFNLGGTWKLNTHLNLLFTGGRDIVGDTHAMAYVGLQRLTK